MSLETQLKEYKENCQNFIAQNKRLNEENQQLTNKIRSLENENTTLKKERNKV